MAKYLRKAQARLSGRQKGCVEARAIAVRNNPKLRDVIGSRFGPVAMAK